MYAIKTKPHNFNWRSIKTKSRDIQLLNTKGHSKLGKQSENPFHLWNNSHWKPEYRCFLPKCQCQVLQFHPQFDDECLHKVRLQFSIITSVTSAAISLFSTISSEPQTWTSPHCLHFMEREAVCEWLLRQSINRRGPGWQRWGETAGLQSCFWKLCTLPSLSPSSSLSLRLLALEHK